MARKNQYNTRILTLKAESPNIQHEEKFRDSRRGNRDLMRRMKWLKNLNEHVNWSKYPVLPTDLNKLKVNIIHN